MRIFFLIAALMCLTRLNVAAQFKQGSVIVGGTISWKSIKETSNGSTDRQTNLMVLPQTGYFVLNNFAIGTGLGLTYNVEKQNSIKQKYRDLSVSPFTRYYFGNFFVQGILNFGKGKTTTDPNNGITTTNKLTGYSFGAGYAILINRQIAIEPSIGYQRNILKGSNTGPQVFQPPKFLDQGLYIQIGFQFYLHKPVLK